MECTLCNRKFKNIPALNGHMRLHGGYYKKDQEKGNGRLTPFSSPSSVSPSLGEKRKPSISSTINGLTVFHAKKEDLQISPKAPPSSSTNLLNHSSLTIQPAAAGAVDLLQPPPSKRHLLSTEGNTFISTGANHPPSDSTHGKT